MLDCCYEGVEDRVIVCFILSAICSCFPLEIKCVKAAKEKLTLANKHPRKILVQNHKHEIQILLSQIVELNLIIRTRWGLAQALKHTLQQRREHYIQDTEYLSLERKDNLSQ